MVEGNGCYNSLQIRVRLLAKVEGVLSSPWPHWTGVEVMGLKDRRTFRVAIRKVLVKQWRRSSGTLVSVTGHQTTDWTRI